MINVLFHCFKDIGTTCGCNGYVHTVTSMEMFSYCNEMFFSDYTLLPTLCMFSMCKLLIANLHEDVKA